MSDREVGIRIVGDNLEVKEKNFAGVKGYNDLCDVVFGLKSQGVIAGVGLSGKSSSKEKGRYFSKMDFLNSVATRFSNADIWYVFDDEGTGHNLQEMMNQIDPEWNSRNGFGGRMSEAERRETMELSWVKASVNKASDWAKAVNGKVLVMEKPDMELGVAAVVLFPKAESLSAGEERFYRGIANQEPENVLTQVSGMLRTGMLNENAYMQSFTSVSMVIEDEGFGRLVEDLAIEPTEEKYKKVIEYYHEHGLVELEEAATVTGLENLTKKVETQRISFAEALYDLHQELSRGVVGVSPYVATAAEMGGTFSYLCPDGGVVVMNVDSRKVCHRSEIGGKEVLVAGRIDPSELVAFVPMNYPKDVREFDKQATVEAMKAVVADLDLYLSIKID